MPSQDPASGRRVHRAQSGYTLAEIMMVVLLVGLLAGIAIPALQKARRTARTNRAKADLRALDQAIAQLAFDTGQYPGGLPAVGSGDTETWDLTGGAGGLTENDGRFQSWRGPYIKSVPQDPWGAAYFFDPDYRVDGIMRPAVGSFGPNGLGPNLYDADDVYLTVD